LTEDGDPEVHVIIKNPKVVPLDELLPADVEVGANGQPDETSARAAMYKVVSNLILVGHVYDATNFDEEQQRPMSLPLSPDDVCRLPWEIVKKVTDLVQEIINPS
jgi:hypothetical protein